MQTVTQTVFFESGMSELVITMLPINNMVFATAMLAWKRQLAGTDNNIIITGEIINYVGSEEQESGEDFWEIEKDDSLCDKASKKEL